MISSTGRHVIIDAWTQESRLLNDPCLVGDILNELVELVGMKILRPAEIVAVPLDPTVKDGEDDGGVTGTVILTTSHGSIHTWPLRGHISFDLFSCKEFNVKTVIDFLSTKFKLTGGQIRSLERTHEPTCRDQWEIIDSGFSSRI